MKRLYQRCQAPKPYQPNRKCGNPLEGLRADARYCCPVCQNRALVHRYRKKTKRSYSTERLYARAKTPGFFRRPHRVFVVVGGDGPARSVVARAVVDLLRKRGVVVTVADQTRFPADRPLLGMEAEVVTRPGYDFFKEEPVGETRVPGGPGARRPRGRPPKNRGDENGRE